MDLTSYTYRVKPFARNKRVLLSELLFAIVIALQWSCDTEQQTDSMTTEADSLMNAVYEARDYNRLLRMADMLQAEGHLSVIKADYWRGYAYSRLQKMRTAEVKWKEAVHQGVKSDDDLEYFAKSANRLAGLLYFKTDYEGTMTVAVPAMQLLKEKGYDMNTDYANLLTFLGCCQLKLGRTSEAANSFSLAYKYYQQLIEDCHDLSVYTSSIVGIITITDTYLIEGYYDEAYSWTDRFESMLQHYREQPNASASYIDKQWARIHLYRACALENQGRSAEAREAYQTALGTDYINTGDGKMEATNYLMAAKHWREAADNFDELESLLSQYDARQSIDIIQNYLMPKYRSNVGANRIDTAVAVGLRICNALDSAIVWENRDAALELAAIYDTQQKENELMEQRAEMSRQRFIGTVVAFILVVVFFLFITFQRHLSAKRLESAYKKLEIANARAEESSRMKTNFIQQISHEIRTPLNILSGFTQVITTPGMTLDAETQADINRQITDNTDRITGLVNKMLELSDVNSQTVLERGDMVPAIQIAAEAVDASGITAAPHLSFDMQLTPEAESAMLQTNLRAAVRVLTLVLDNARKFTAPAEAKQRGAGADASPSATASSDKPQKALLKMEADAAKVVFAVEDSGPGVPANEAEHIFDEFVQLDEYYDGTGIGLTVARSLARRLGGDLKLDTSFTSGARFVLTLPASENIA